MGKRKSDIDIGYRAAEECSRLFSTTREAIMALGCGDNVIYEWSQGRSPSAMYLARLHKLGADVIWILTGKRCAGYGNQ